MVAVLRRFSLVEGISTLVLFLVAMPLKYVLGYPMAVTYVGWVHGVLFVGLWLLFLLVVGMRKIPVLLALLGMIAGMWAVKHDSLAAITNFIVQPLAFLSGTFYSVDRLPAPFDTVASINPIFMAIDGFRYAMIGISDRSVLVSAIVLLVLNAVLSVLCYHLLARGWRLKS